ncbi:MAG: hypothetical protein MJZ38_07290 [archaeon]|nr:hypothetical protein [archaeon]
MVLRIIVPAVIIVAAAAFFIYGDFGTGDESTETGPEVRYLGSSTVLTEDGHDHVTSRSVKAIDNCFSGWYTAQYGWNTKRDGTGTHLNPGDRIPANVECLYPVMCTLMGFSDGLDYLEATVTVSGTIDGEKYTSVMTDKGTVLRPDDAHVRIELPDDARITKGNGKGGFIVEHKWRAALTVRLGNEPVKKAEGFQNIVEFDLDPGRIMEDLYLYDGLLSFTVRATGETGFNFSLKMHYENSSDWITDRFNNSLYWDDLNLKGCVLTMKIDGRISRVISDTESNRVFEVSGHSDRYRMSLSYAGCYVSVVNCAVGASIIEIRINWYHTLTQNFSVTVAKA